MNTSWSGWRFRRCGDGGGTELACGLVSKSFGVAEVLVSPRSNLIGTDIFPGMVTESGSLVVLAHQRAGKSGANDVTAVKAGDTLLLQGSWNALDKHTRDQNVLLVESPDAIRRQTVPLGPGAIPALVILMTTNIVPASVAALLAAMAMVLTGGGSPYLLLLGIFVVTAVLGQLISNTATALIIIPIALSVASEASLAPLTVLMCVSVASAAALLTPIATPANMMVMRPAGYKFGDYWKFGLVIMALYVAVAVFLVPVFWPFH